MTWVNLLAAIGLVVVFLTAVYEILRCKHAWEFVDKTEFMPPIETAKKNSADWGLSSNQRESMSKKTVVIVLRCPKCGVPKILRESH